MKDEESACMQRNGSCFGVVVLATTAEGSVGRQLWDWHRGHIRLFSYLTIYICLTGGVLQLEHQIVALHST